jgi:hypothetical protein
MKMTPYPNLLIWWAGTIIAGTLFLVFVSIILYFTSKEARVKTINPLQILIHVLKDFAFVWVLLSLLILYIVSIEGGNYILFAAGNIVVEIFIFLYLIVTRKLKGLEEE